MSRYVDPPEHLVSEVSAICQGLPEVDEESAWAGTRWRVRRRTFAQILGIVASDADSDDDASFSVVTFRSDEPELGVLIHAGHPFFKAGWGTNVIGMVLDERRADWDEVGELLTESYCILAPKKLVALIDRPGDD